MTSISPALKFYSKSVGHPSKSGSLSTFLSLVYYVVSNTMKLIKIYKYYSVMFSSHSNINASTLNMTSMEESG